MSKTPQKVDQSYWGIVKRQFNKNRLAVWSLRMVYVIFFIGIMADFIANDKPVFCRINGNSYFPIFKRNMSRFIVQKPSAWFQR